MVTRCDRDASDARVAVALQKVVLLYFDGNKCAGFMEVCVRRAAGLVWNERLQYLREEPDDDRLRAHFALCDSLIEARKCDESVRLLVYGVHEIGYSMNQLKMYKGRRIFDD